MNRVAPSAYGRVVMRCARNLAPGMRLTREIPDPDGGYGDVIEVEPYTITAIEPYDGERLLLSLDTGRQLPAIPSERLAVVVTPSSKRIGGSS